jgi:hypothetical protein
MQDGVEPLVSTLDGWCWRVAVGRSLGRPVRHARLLLRFLSVHHDWTVKQYWADDYAADLHALWVRCKTLTGTFGGRPEPMDGIVCPFCDRMALVRTPGQPGRTCDRADGGCGKWLTDDEYERWTRMEDHAVRQTTMIRYQVWDHGDLRTGMMMSVETDYDWAAQQWVATSDDDGHAWVGRADTHQGAHLALLADRLGLHAEVTMPLEPDEQAEEAQPVKEAG